MAKNDKQVKRGVYLYIDGKQINNDINSIDVEVRKLQRDIKAMQRGSEEYNRTMAKIQHLKKILRDHQQEIKGVTEEHKKASLSVRGMVDWFNQFGGAIVAAIGFLTGVTLALRKFRDERNKLETAQASLKALTGLDDDSISWLTEQAKTLSTTMTKEGLRVRQSAAEILDAFMLIGSAKPELLGDKEALKQVTEEAMRLQAAAGDIKLSEAVDSLTLALNQYGEAADQAARYANVLAAGSQAGSANIASQASAIRNAGTAAASANVSIEQTVGLIETLAYRGIKDEVAGTGLKKFFLTLQTGADETNPKIVGLEKALENLVAKNMGAADIKKMFGEEGYNTASVLMQNTQMVKDYTKAVTDTNVATEQAAINSNTAAAALDQARNKMLLAAADLGEKLTPAFTISTNMATNLVKILPGLIDWFKEWGGTVALLVTPLMVYWGYQKLSIASQKTWNIVTAAGTKVAALFKGSIYLLQTAFYLLTGQIAKARGAIVLFNMTTNLNPYAATAALITAIGTAFFALYTRANQYMTTQRAINKLSKEANSDIDQQSGRLETLWRIASDNNIELNKRKEAIAEINSISPKYLGDINLETINTDKARLAKEKYIEKLKEEAMLKGAQKHIERESSELIELQRELDDALEGQAKAREGATYAQTGATAYDAPIVMLNEKIRKTEAAIKAYTEVYKKYADLLKDDTESDDSDNTTLDPNPSPTTSPTTGDEPDNKFAALEEAHQRRINEIKKRYLKDDLMTTKQYNQEMQQAQLDLLNEKMKVAGIEPKEREKINQQLLDLQIKLRDELIKEQAKEASNKHEKAYQLQVDDATRKHYEQLTEEEDYLAELARIRQEYYSSMLNDTAVSEEDKNKIREAMRKDDLENLKKTFEKEQEQREKDIEKAKEMTNLYKSMFTEAGQQLGESFANVITGQKDAMRKMWKNMLLTAIDALQQYIRITYIQVMLESLKPFGFATALPKLAKIAAIEAAFAAVKGVVNNFYTGGFTPSGAWDQPQGIVHSNEFVANRFAVANPNLRPLFDAIDVAQKSGNVGKLTMDDVVAVSRHTQSNPNSSGHTTNIAGYNGKETAILIASVNLLNGAVKKLSDRLDKDINAVVTISGRNGLRNKLDEYDKLLNNKNR